MKQLILWALTICFTADSAVRVVRTNFNLGTFLMYCITAALWVYTLFNRPIDRFCAAGPGRVLKILFFCGCAFAVGMMLFIAAAGVSDRAKGDEKAVVVLGAGLRGERVSSLLARRLNAAYDFYAAHPDVLIVVTGGQGPQEKVPEAHAMRDYLLAKGVPADKLLVEDKSTSTEENFLFARRLLEAAGVSPQEPVAYATNAFHCYRAGCYARAAGFADARAVPASIGFTSVLPCYLREVFAVLYYWAFKR